MTLVINFTRCLEHWYFHYLVCITLTISLKLEEDIQWKNRKKLPRCKIRPNDIDLIFRLNSVFRWKNNLIMSLTFRKFKFHTHFLQFFVVNLWKRILSLHKEFEIWIRKLQADSSDVIMLNFLQKYILTSA